MRKGDTGHYAKRTPPPPNILPVLERAKRAYILWSEFRPTLPNTKRYSLGERIDSLLIEIIESMAAASFLPRGEKEVYVRVAIRKLDTLRVLLMVAWESRALDTKKYAAISEVIEDVGRQLGGWYGQLMRQNKTPR
jgi:hypothetical protein